MSSALPAFPSPSTSAAAAATETTRRAQLLDQASTAGSTHRLSGLFRVEKLPVPPAPSVIPEPGIN